MRLNVEKNILVTSLWLALSLATATSYADGFYTIIGPDGHPMIVQKTEPKKKPEAITQKNPKLQEDNELQRVVKKNNNNLEQRLDQKVRQTQVFHESHTDVKKEIDTKQIEKDTQPLHDSSKVQTEAPIKQEVAVEAKNNQVASQYVQKIVPSKSISEQKLQKNVTDKKQQQYQQALPESVKSTEITPSIQNKTVEVKNIEQPRIHEKKDVIAVTENKNFTEIDGIQYVNNEYLEDREFNLEGKKRFYMTPEAGAVHGRYETVERQKGVSASLLDRIRNKSEPQEHKAVVLSTHYFRLPKDDVVKNLEQACFTGKKVAKAKSLSIKNQELGLWPVAPIKEHFAYEVVKLDSQVQNVLLTSYASSSKVQTYYWPLVVFLDQQGCVIEGVSGFKNEESDDNNTQYAAMEGILRKPENATYMFLTPLSSAVDADNKQLTNHGQIKLSVIQ
ncbi:putative pilus assembly protein FilE [Acinetobacter wuhouensis]|uniref:putative pilus assembly protein FilE n=1 Tax=Acinetobacter wuhouensis TaxID=1879050 RepID=UPI00083AFFF4|nr:putative pilus assembly protein FilE [Acinetobacter wuhouensis]AXQ21420.1 putative pilus assembly protein FilE [Acinetobacter wuhouensis]